MVPRALLPSWRKNSSCHSIEKQNHPQYDPDIIPHQVVDVKSAPGNEILKQLHAGGKQQSGQKPGPHAPPQHQSKKSPRDKHQKVHQIITTYIQHSDVLHRGHRFIYRQRDQQEDGHHVASEKPVVQFAVHIYCQRGFLKISIKGDPVIR